MPGVTSRSGVSSSEWGAPPRGGKACGPQCVAAADLAPTIALIRAKGATTLQVSQDGLNVARIPTPHGLGK